MTADFGIIENNDPDPDFLIDVNVPDPLNVPARQKRTKEEEQEDKFRIIYPQYYCQTKLTIR